MAKDGHVHDVHDVQGVHASAAFPFVWTHNWGSAPNSEVYRFGSPREQCSQPTLSPISTFWNPKLKGDWSLAVDIVEAIKTTPDNGDN